MQQAGQGVGQGRAAGQRRQGRSEQNSRVGEARGVANFAKWPPRTGLEPPRSLKSARWRLRGRPWRVPFFFFFFWGGGGRQNGRRPAPVQVRGLRGCYRRHGCGEAGERLGSLCAIEVEGLKCRPPTEVGGLGLEFGRRKTREVDGSVNLNP